MQRALELALLAPEYGENPQVGALIISASGEILAEGWHKGAGTPHAEIDALTKLAAKGISANGLTAVVTLEPCNHTGKTGPCSEALIQAGISRVVFGTQDPGKTEGGGRFKLEEAGIEVISDVLENQARALIQPWFVNKFESRPYVVIKWAASIDGRTAATDGTSKWITGAAAREDVHLRRSRSQSILAGTNTVEIDDPELTARKPDGSLYENQPLRVILGTRQISADSRVFNKDAETIQLKTHDIRAALNELFNRGIRQVFVEGGAKVESEMIRSGYADEFLIYLAPKLIGGERNAIGDIGVETISGAVNLEFIETKQLGADIFIRAVKSNTSTSSTKPEHNQKEN